MNSGAQAYRSLGVSTQIDGADQHALIQMLFDGGIERLRRARGCIDRGEVANRNEALNAVVAIVAGLQGSLDHDLG
jgi:flagellar protein FliS